MARDFSAYAGITYTATDKASPVVAKAAKKVGRSASLMERSAKRMRSAFKGIGKAVFSLKGAVGAFIAYAGTRALIGWMQESIRLAGIQESAVMDLASAFHGLGVENVDKATKSFAKFASGLQQTTNYGDEATMSAAAMGLRFGIAAEDIQEATLAAADFAAGAKLELVNAMRIVGIAASGRTTMLSRYGVEVDKNIPKNKALAASLEALNKKFKGAAAAQAATYAGRINDLSNAYGDLREIIGFTVTASKTINAFLEVSVQRIAALTEEIDMARGGADLMADAFLWVIQKVATLVEVGGFVIQMFLGLKTVGQTAIGGLVLIFAGLVKGVQLTLAPLGLVLESLKELGVIDFNPLGEGLTSVADAAVKSADALAEDVRESAQSMVDIDTKTAAAAMAVRKFGADVFVAASKIKINTEALGKNIKKVKELEGALGGIELVDIPLPTGEAMDMDESMIQAMLDRRTAYRDKVLLLDEEVLAGKYAYREKVKTLAQEEQDLLNSTAASIGVTWATTLASMANDTENAGKKIATAIIDMAITSVRAYVASASAAAAFSQAGIPIIGPILAIGAASAMGALIKGFLKDVPKAAGGGMIMSGAPGVDNQTVLGQKGEGILKPGQTKAIIRLADATDGKGSRSTTNNRSTNVTLNMQALDISEPETKKKMLLGLAREIEELVDDDLLLASVKR